MPPVTGLNDWNHQSKGCSCDSDGEILRRQRRRGRSEHLHTPMLILGGVSIVMTRLIKDAFGSLEVNSI
ncbi:hypothetical protein E3N88_20223 [Mikania micrantha]|uniref:Uncharacterized protein n=1 Tax=Mikania micrantha TaxID=192012 RepID=A0A5N6NHK5_9ASTR|nr:hypothetical protein E3N88_20222 [Mikania micrantha]KAD4888150.1 hypothetical protein E3N88_20223 [Mikania micrantha]